MKVTLSKICTLLVSAWFFHGAVFCASAEQALVEPVKFLTHSVGEQLYVDVEGHLRGKPNGGRRAFNVELVREMMLMMGQPPVFEIVPFKRGLSLVQSSPGYALFNVNRTEGREDTVRWVGPIQNSVTHFYENREVPTGIENLEDARHVDAICVLRGNVHHQYLEKQGFTNIYPVNRYANCVDMLERKRADLTPLSNLSTLVNDSQGRPAGILQKTGVELMTSSGYLVFSRETPTTVVEQWQAVLDDLVKSGRYDELVEEFLADDTE